MAREKSLRSERSGLEGEREVDEALSLIVHHILYLYLEIERGNKAKALDILLRLEGLFDRPQGQYYRVYKKLKELQNIITKEKLSTLDQLKLARLILNDLIPLILPESAQARIRDEVRAGDQLAAEREYKSSLRKRLSRLFRRTTTTKE